MKLAYVDTSCLVAIAFGEPGADAVTRRLESFDELVSSNTLESELLTAYMREGVAADEDLFTWLTFVIPNRALSPEIETVLATGYQNGAQAWHLACALFLVSDPGDLAFVTLDKRQEEAAKELGFAT